MEQTPTQRPVTNSRTWHGLFFADGGQAEGLDVWRAAADLVSTRWQMFREADPESRRRAFASYVAALDAEEAAAADVESLHVRKAA